MQEIKNHLEHSEGLGVSSSPLEDLESCKSPLIKGDLEGFEGLGDICTQDSSSLLSSE